MIDKLEAIKARFEQVGIALTNPEVVSDNQKFKAMSKEYSSLEKIVTMYEKYKTARTGSLHCAQGCNALQK